MLQIWLVETFFHCYIMICSSNLEPYGVSNSCSDLCRYKLVYSGHSPQDIADKGETIWISRRVLDPLRTTSIILNTSLFFFSWLSNVYIIYGYVIMICLLCPSLYIIHQDVHVWILEQCAQFSHNKWLILVAFCVTCFHFRLCD